MWVLCSGHAGRRRAAVWDLVPWLSQQVRADGTQDEMRQASLSSQASPLQTVAYSAEQIQIAVTSNETEAVIDQVLQSGLLPQGPDMMLLWESPVESPYSDLSEIASGCRSHFRHFQIEQLEIICTKCTSSDFFWSSCQVPLVFVPLRCVVDLFLVSWLLKLACDCDKVSFALFSTRWKLSLQENLAFTHLHLCNAPLCDDVVIKSEERVWLMMGEGFYIRCKSFNFVKKQASFVLINKFERKWEQTVVMHISFSLELTHFTWESGVVCYLSPSFESEKCQ